MEKETLENQVEQCPLIGYCVDGARLSSIEVCRGEKGNFRECGAYIHYAEQDRIREENRIAYLS